MALRKSKKGLAGHVSVTGDEDLLKIIDELGDLGDPRWVMGRYTAALKESMVPVLEMAKMLAPWGSGNLSNSLVVTSRKLKSGVVEARMGVDKNATFLIRKGGNLTSETSMPPVQYVASIEFGNKNGVKAQPFIRPAYNATGRTSQIVPRIASHMIKSMKKRTKFLKKGIK